MGELLSLGLCFEKKRSEDTEKFHLAQD